jgi:GPH family glycoside/pentoside/hexuronide:cation symporter
MATGVLAGVLWMPYFNIGMGINPTSLGIVLAILLTWNAFSDPLMGNISDNARTRWGRRRPFIAVGSVLTASLYPLFFFIPTGLSETGKLIYLTAVGIAFYSCFTIWAMPYYGFQMELTPNYDERTRLTSWVAAFGKLSALMGGWILAIATSHWFLNPVTGKGDILIGMKVLCWFLAGGIMLFGLLPALFVKERFYEGEANHQPREPFWKSIKDSAQCRPLWTLIGITFFMILGSSAVGALGQYVNIYYIFDGDISAASIVGGWKGTVIVVTGILLIPFWAWLGEQFDKKTVVFSMLSFTMIGHLTNYFFMRPDMPYLQLISGVFESAAISAVWLFIPSMKADTADVDELHTGRRREGSINSFFSWFVKASLTCSAGVSGFVLDFSGFTSKTTHQSPATLHQMLWIYLLLPIGIWAIALVIAGYYPLSRSRMARRGLI